MLDAEIAALPENYRLPLVLCYLQELTHEEAARRIGCEPGVLRGRLDRGRDRLRLRLARYGLPLAAPALVFGAPPPVSAALVERTVAVVMASAGSGVPPALAALLGGSPRWRAVLLAPAVTVLAFVLAAAGQPVEAPPAPAPAAHATQPVAKAAPTPTTDVFGDPLPPGAVARLGSIRFHHGETIESMIVGADGKLVASRGRDGYKLWDGESGRPIALWDGLTKPGPQHIRFTLSSAGAKLVAIVRDQNESRLIDPVSGETIRKLPPISELSVAGLAPDGKTVAVLQRDIGAQGLAAFRIWNADKERWTDLGPCSGQAVFHNPIQFSTDSKRVAYWLTDGSVSVWDAGTAKSLLQLPPTGQQFTEAVCFSPDGKLLAREDQKTTKVRMWDVDTGKELPELADQPERLGQFLAFSPDGKTLAGGAKATTIRIWDLGTRKKLRDIQVHDFQVFHAAFTGDGKRLFAADGRRVSVWDAATGKPVDDTGGHRYTISDATWSRDGTRVVSGASYTDNVARVWDATTGRKVLEFVGHKSGIERIAYSPDGSLLATGSQDGTVRLWEPVTGKELHSFVAKDGMVRALTFTPDGKFLVSGGQKALHVWDVIGRKEVRTIPHTGGVVSRLVFFRDGKRVLVRDGAPGARVIDFATGKEEFRLAEKWSGAVAVSPDERYLALADKDGAVGLADAGTGRELRVLVEPVAKEPGDRGSPALEFSPDGRTLAATHGADVRVYEVATGSERLRFTGHVGKPWGVRFSPDGTRLCTFATDRTLLIWDATGGRLSPAPTPQNADAAWADLADPSARKGFAAIRYLSTDPTAALKFITDRVEPLAPADPKILAALIGKLGSSDFAEREGASKELTALAPTAATQVREAAGKSDVPEVRTRLNAILTNVKETKLSGEHLRAVRAVEVLERIGTPEAQKLLARLATGGPDLTLTRDAAGALGRLKGKK